MHAARLFDEGVVEEMEKEEEDEEEERGEEGGGDLISLLEYLGPTFHSDDLLCAKNESGPTVQLFPLVI